MGYNMKILVSTAVNPSKKNLRTVYINTVLKSLRKKITTKIIWIVYQPEKVQVSDDSCVAVRDIHEFSSGVEMLKTLKPDYVLVTNSLEPIQLSISLAAKFLKIPLVCFYYNEPVTKISTPNASHISVMTLRNIFSDSVSTDSPEEKRFMRRGRFFFYKYWFLTKTRKSLKENYSQIIESFYKDANIYLSNKKFQLNTLPDLHLIPNEQMLQELVKMGFIKEKLIVTGNPFWDNLHQKLQNKMKLKRPNNKIKLLIFTDALYEHGIWSNKQRTTFLQKLFLELQKNGDVSFALKIHPTSESKVFYEKFLQKLEIKAPIFQNEDIWDIISDFDLTLSYGFSTLHTEIAAAGIKMILLDIDFNFGLMSLVKEGIQSGHIKKCSNFKDLTPLIHKFAKEEIVLTDEFRRERETIFFKFDGKAGERVAEAILRIKDYNR